MNMEKSYSQAGQDEFVLSLFNKNYKGIFVDIGCYKPNEINNTLLLEENGWTGISLDVMDYGNEWRIRKTPFICDNALTCNYGELFKQYDIPNIIDYLSLDIEGDGQRYQTLKKIMESGYVFKVMTVEHDTYRSGYDLCEKMPQRKLLNGMGYYLLCSDVWDGKPFEDWWINPKYFDESEYMFYKCSDTPFFEILNKFKINNLRNK